MSQGSFKVIVIGGGHAGVEAASAAARLGAETCLVTLRRSGIGQMSCNPAIGGLGKGQLVKEVDALGGLMGRAIDHTGIQFRTLNSSKGPAVRASRAQADRDLYKSEVLRLLENQPRLKIVEAEVQAIEAEHGRVRGVRLKNGTFLKAESVVLTSGTFLRGLMHTGAEQVPGGRHGDGPANFLSDSLRTLGFELGRLKTGTPPRLRKSTINFVNLKEQPGEVPARPFSMMSGAITQKQISCWMTATNEAVHELIRANRERSPMFNGQIKSSGPRYCPSIEDKVFRFADKISHTIFLEPEGYESDIVYPNGISTSLPIDIQQEFVRKIAGLENVEILQPGYAVEYDFVDPRSLRPTLETKLIEGLYFAGQINGTSGYEEAAGQGLVAGANAALKLLGLEPLIISRGNGYIGVMIDDLITTGVDEPYRMFTSRAEYRLVLREDNAWLRLCPVGIELGLVQDEQRRLYERHLELYSNSKEHIVGLKIKPTAQSNEWLKRKNSAQIKDSISLSSLVCRPELGLKDVLELYPLEEEISSDLLDALEIEFKFGGYLARQDEEIRRLKRSEAEVIPDDFRYDEVPGLRVEFQQRLKKFRPYSLGHALRIPGMTPSAVSILSIYLKRHRELAA